VVWGEYTHEFEVRRMPGGLEKFLRKLAPSELALAPKAAALDSLTKTQDLIYELGVVSLSNDHSDTLR